MPRWQSTGSQLRLWFCFAALVLVVSGCVTTTNAPEPKVDLEKAEKTHIEAGLGYLRQRNKESAERHFLKALEINRQSAGAHNGLAMVRQIEKDPKRAEVHFRKAISIDPEFSSARNNYAALLFRQDRFADAEAQLLKVVEDYTYERRAVALMNLGITQRKLGKQELALESLRQSVGVNLRIAPAHLELADMYYERGDLKSAQFYYQQYLKLSRQSARSLLLGIRLETALGNQNKVASYALALKNLHPDSDEYRQYQRGLR